VIPRRVLVDLITPNLLVFSVQWRWLPILIKIQKSMSCFIIPSISTDVHSRYIKKLANGSVKVRARDLPSFIWPKDGYDPQDITYEMFRNPVLIMVWIVRCMFSILTITTCLFRFSNIFLHRHRPLWRSSQGRQRPGPAKPRRTRWPRLHLQLLLTLVSRFVFDWFSATYYWSP
jgi:hypothetical protein